MADKDPAPDAATPASHKARGFTISIHVGPDGNCTGKIGTHEVVSGLNYAAAFAEMKRAGIPAANEHGINLGY